MYKYADGAAAGERCGRVGVRRGRARALALAAPPRRARPLDRLPGTGTAGRRRLPEPPGLRDPDAERHELDRHGFRLGRGLSRAPPRRRHRRGAGALGRRSAGRRPRRGLPAQGAGLLPPLVRRRARRDGTSRGGGLRPARGEPRSPPLGAARRQPGLLSHGRRARAPAPRRDRSRAGPRDRRREVGRVRRGTQPVGDDPLLRGEREFPPVQARRAPARPGDGADSRPRGNAGFHLLRPAPRAHDARDPRDLLRAADGGPGRGRPALALPRGVPGRAVRPGARDGAPADEGHARLEFLRHRRPRRPGAPARGGRRGDRQPREGRGGPGDPEHEPDVRLPGDRGALGGGRLSVIEETMTMNATPLVQAEKIEIESGTATSPQGFRAAGLHCGIKRERPDLALLVSEVPASVAGVFTTNRVKAAPVRYTQAAVARGRAQAIVVNSGNANACTGEAGLADAAEMAALTGAALDLDPDLVLVSSTGVIGVPLPMEAIRAGIPRAARSLTSDGRDAAEAIRTTDRYPKTAAVRLEIGGVGVTIGGMAKGAGMIHPNMATTLCFLTTDAALPPAVLRLALSRAVADSFNSITVDGDTSTNDTVLLLANGRAEGATITNGSELTRFTAGLTAVASELAKMVVRDGEGATRLVAIEVSGAVSDV